MPSIGAPELLIICVIALLVLGPKRLPEAGRSLGSGLRQFKDAVDGHLDREEAPAVEREGARE